MKASKGNPIFLTDTVTVTPGQTGIPNIAVFANPNRRAMYVDEIDFTIVSNLAVGLSASVFNPIWWGGVIRTQITLGNWDLSRAFVPIWLLAQPTDERNEMSLSNGIASVANAAEFYRWVLPTPLYVPENVTFTPKFQFVNPQAATDFTNISITVGVRGRELIEAEPTGKTRPVPFAGVFVKDSLSGTAFDVISDEKNLVNQFENRPFNVHRFAFRAYCSDGDDRGEITSACSVQVLDALKNDVIGTVLPAVGTFAFYNRTWTTPGVVLQPRDYYTARVKLSGTLAGNSAGIGVAVAMIGTRMEVYGG